MSDHGRVRARSARVARSLALCLGSTVFLTSISGCAVGLCCAPLGLAALAASRKADSDSARAHETPSVVSRATREATRVSFYRVPLVCAAAPQIGCGSRARPILLDLEHLPPVAQAWLNRSGTVLAVVWEAERDPGTTTKEVNSLLQSKGLTPVELVGEEREHVLEGFSTRSGWYRGEEVDRLSEEEAGVIAARLVRRVSASVVLPDQDAEALRSAFETVFRKRFLDGSRNSGKTRSAQMEAELVKAARRRLDKRGITALREAIALGYRPQPSEF